MIVWISGCAMADYVLLFEARAWTMAWGFVVGTASVCAMYSALNYRGSDE